MPFTNQDKVKIFNDWLGGRFKTFEVATPDTAPISFVAKDNEDREYYVFVNVAKELSINDNNRYETGIKIANTHFYHLYGMCSQDMNVFWFEAFNDGYMLFYLKDCLTPEQLKVTDEFTMIGVASALHVEKPKKVVTIGGSLDIQKNNKPKITRKKKR